MNAETADQLVAQFRAHLEASGDPPEAYGSSDGTLQTDLFSLFTELAALKNEVRLESRQLKGALEEFGQLFDTLRDANQRLERELDTRRQLGTEALQGAERPLLLEILELRDRIEAGLGAARGYRPKGLARLSAKPSGFIGDLGDGMAISLRRVDELLARYRVRVLAAVGEPLDPHTMHAAGIESRDDQADGIVLAEVRKGFVRGEESLRLAEVIVNKRDTP